MACTFIENGRPLDCKDSVGGLKAVYFVQFDEATNVGFVQVVYKLLLLLPHQVLLINSS